MKHKAIIALILVVIVVVIAAAALASDDDDSGDKNGNTTTDDTPTAYIEANWREDVCHTIAGSDGFSTTADEGKEYVVLSYTIANNTDYEIKLNPLIFQWCIWADNVSYEVLYGTSMMYLDCTLSTVAKGGTASQQMAFEIPDGATLQDVEVKYTGIDNIGSLIHRDTSIVVPVPTGLS